MCGLCGVCLCVCVCPVLLYCEFLSICVSCVVCVMCGVCGVRLCYVWFVVVSGCVCVCVMCDVCVEYVRVCVRACAYVTCLYLCAFRRRRCPPCRPQGSGSVLSGNAGVVAALLLSSRLPSLTHAYAFLALALFTCLLLPPAIASIQVRVCVCLHVCPLSVRVYAAARACGWHPVRDARTLWHAQVQEPANFRVGVAVVACLAVWEWWELWPPLAAASAVACPALTLALPWAYTRTLTQHAHALSQSHTPS